MKISIGDLKRLIREVLSVGAEAQKSRISGVGLFATEFIPRGTVVSSWVEGIDHTYPADYPDSLPPAAAREFMKYASWDGDAWYISGDDGVYFNHSDEPNVRVSPEEGLSPAEWDRVAVRDIQPGEELTMDYGEIGEPP